MIRYALRCDQGHDFDGWFRSSDGFEAMRDAAMGFRKLRAACEAYTSSSPYAVWQELLRETLELGREATDDVALVIDINEGPDRAHLMTSDLGYKYIEVNAEYTT